MAGTAAGHVYEIGPIDWWTAWSELEDAVENVQELTGDEKDMTRRELEAIRDRALALFRERTLWEGDIVTGPLFAGLPPVDGDADSAVMMAIKQSNNGSVFIWAPFQLPWLKEYER